MMLLAICISILVIGIVFFPRRNKHQRNILNSRRILTKINTFQYPGQRMNYLRKIDPFVFEELLLTHFENKGFKIIRNKKYTGDGGFDGTIFNKNNEKILIQAKRYTNYIHKKDLLNFEQLVIENHCKGFFIHTGKTSKNNLLFADNENISIYSGNKLLDLLN